MWREPASLSFSAIKLDVIRLRKDCKLDVFGLIEVEIGRRLVLQGRKLFMRGRKGVPHDWNFICDRQSKGLAEVLSISFLCLSTSTLTKKTEMNPNRTFPDLIG